MIRSNYERLGKHRRMRESKEEVMVTTSFLVRPARQGLAVVMEI